MEWYQYTLIIGAGIVAGFINTLAGSGSLLTLPLLMFIGLPPNIANGTNRVAIMLQSLVGSMGFRKQGLLNLRTGFILGIPSMLGSVAGALLALTINTRSMEKVVGVLLIIMFFIVLFNKLNSPLRIFSCELILVCKSIHLSNFLVSFNERKHGVFHPGACGIAKADWNAVIIKRPHIV